MKRLLAIFTLLILTACAAPVTATPTSSATLAPTAIPSDTPPPTATPTSTATPTITASPTGTATLTPTFGPSPTPSLTPTLASWIEEDFLFGEPTVEGCELPCWQGLTPGVSSAEEAEQFFLQMFGVRRFDSIVEAEAYSEPTWPLLVCAWRSWRFDHTPTSPFYGTGISTAFSTETYLNRTTKDLAAIRFRWTGLLFDYTPARFIRELGQPSQILIRVGKVGPGQPPSRFTPFIVIYEELGVTFSAMIAFPDQESLEICLDGTFWNGQYDGRERYVILTPTSNGPFPSTEEEWLLLDVVKIDRLSPFETVMGVTLEEVTQQIQSGGSPCWWYTKE